MQLSTTKSSRPTRYSPDHEYPQRAHRGRYSDSQLSAKLSILITIFILQRLT